MKPFSGRSKSVDFRHVAEKEGGWGRGERVSPYRENDKTYYRDGRENRRISMTRPYRESEKSISPSSWYRQRRNTSYHGGEYYYSSSRQHYSPGSDIGCPTDQYYSDYKKEVEANYRPRSRTSERRRQEKTPQREVKRDGGKPDESERGRLLDRDGEDVSDERSNRFVRYIMEENGLLPCDFYNRVF